MEKSRLLSHLSHRAYCGLTDRRGVVLDSVLIQEDWDWTRNAHARLERGR
jgi:hypothetical protein